MYNDFAPLGTQRTATVQKQYEEYFDIGTKTKSSTCLALRAVPQIRKFELGRRFQIRKCGSIGCCPGKLYSIAEKRAYSNVSGRWTDIQIFFMNLKSKIRMKKNIRSAQRNKKNYRNWSFSAFRKFYGEGRAIAQRPIH